VIGYGTVKKRDLTGAKIWIEENGQKKIEIAWSELSASEEVVIIEAIDKHWDEFNRMIDDVFAGKKIRIKTIK
jgi:hypothetical protein